MKTLHLNPHLFFLIEDGGILVWDYKNHNQYQLEATYFERLQQIKQTSQAPIDNLSQDLIDGGLISATPFPDSPWGWDALSKIYHIGTQNPLSNHNLDDYQAHFKTYINYCDNSLPDAPAMETEKTGELINLPQPNGDLLKKTSLWTALQQRKTCRDFDGTPIALPTLSTLLHTVFGLKQREEPQLKKLNLAPHITRTSPSVGGLNSCEAYVIALNVDDLARGVYHYRSHAHQLTRLKKKDYRNELGSLLFGQQFAERLGVCIVITARFDKCWHKYKHSRGYNALLVDAGHLSQTFQLCAPAFDLKTWITGLFVDNEMMKVLQLTDNSNEYPLFVLGAGNGTECALSYEMQNMLSRKK